MLCDFWGKLDWEGKTNNSSNCWVMGNISCVGDIEILTLKKCILVCLPAGEGDTFIIDLYGAISPRLFPWFFKDILYQFWCFHRSYWFEVYLNQEEIFPSPPIFFFFALCLYAYFKSFVFFNGEIYWLLQKTFTSNLDVRDFIYISFSPSFDCLGLHSAGSCLWQKQRMSGMNICWTFLRTVFKSCFPYSQIVSKYLCGKAGVKLDHESFWQVPNSSSAVTCVYIIKGMFCAFYTS